ncbi:MAG: hypothetical protein HY272_08610 [Gammaproteobacteria bacterium]|nr:hypothetical protein [Gammaproteobacteria bacterium]
MIRHLLATLILSMFSMSALAESIDHAGCNNDVTVYVDKMGIVNEERLHEHLEQAKNSLDEIRRMKAGSNQRRYLLNVHLSKMQQAMEEMHNLKLASDCSAAAHGASIETRISVIEKRMDMMHDMIEQIIGHQQESGHE